MYLQVITATFLARLAPQSYLVWINFHLCINVTVEGQGHPMGPGPGKDPKSCVHKAGWASRPVSTDTENLAPTGTGSTDRSAL